MWGLNLKLMAKREVPLFIIDTSRKHKKGECDWVFCTDKDNAFVGKIDYLDGDVDEAGDDYRITSNGKGISARITILRQFGANPDTANIRTLLKRAMTYYLDITKQVVHSNNPNRQECIDFIELLIQSNMHYLDEAGSDFSERQTILTSMQMLHASAQYLKKDNEDN